MDDDTPAGGTEPAQPPLRLVPGGRERRLGAVRVHVQPALGAPFVPELRVVEDDTYGVLAADPRVRWPDESPLRTYTQAASFEPFPLGTLRPGPVGASVAAVVYDLDRGPRTTEAALARVVDEVWAHLDQARISRLAIPLLGQRDHRLGPLAAWAALHRLWARPPDPLRDLWVVLDEDRIDEGLDALDQWLDLAAAP